MKEYLVCTVDRFGSLHLCQPDVNMLDIMYGLFSGITVFDIPITKELQFYEWTDK